jgi:hypothetical protein
MVAMMARAHAGNFRKWALLLTLFSVSSSVATCAEASPRDRGDDSEESAATSASAEKAPSSKQAPATLLAWQVGAQPNQETQAESTSEDSPIKTDRPTFTPSSSTVGKDTIQLETGYTFTHERGQDVTVESHSYPEANLRFGILADWLEGRIAQNLASTNTTGLASSVSHTGAADLLLGVKLGLTKQQACLPETAVILQMSVPTGSSFLTQKEVEPGVIGIYGWEVIKNRLSVSGSLSANRTLDGAGHYYTLFAESLVLDWSLSKQLDAFSECYALTPCGAIDSATGPQPFFDTGMTFKVTPNLQLDGHAGLGLNHHADEFFAGLGLSVRF